MNKNKHHILAKPPYGNCQVLSPNGDLMFRGHEKRVRWYLDRGLAEEVQADPLTIRLLFEPGGHGHVGDDFYLDGKKNVCVVCGSEEALTMHHLLPKCYFKFFPTHLKSHQSYDLMPLCIKCHEKYEVFALRRKNVFAKRYDAPLHDIIDPLDKEKNRIWGLAGALLRHSDQIPAGRKEEITDVIRNFLGKEGELTAEDLERVASMTKKELKDDADRSPHGRKVVGIILESIDGIDDFAIEWRKHFVFTMKPRFLPENWDPERRTYAGKTNDVGIEQEAEAHK